MVPMACSFFGAAKKNREPEGEPKTDGRVGRHVQIDQLLASLYVVRLCLFFSVFVQWCHFVVSLRGRIVEFFHHGTEKNVFGVSCKSFVSRSDGANADSSFFLGRKMACKLRGETPYR